ncbi:MAG: hydrogenobyrinic acid a,c-diamide synthase (glutamine-hydrolysing) [Candidatus Atelocyanobacterium thalassa isolate SIO64986]|uniref:Cobyrinate a,c-diamide synthase n=1 Tax=Candidatus Atelocyanobacterium thalassa isolate SIO64986 TaxID=1527444 RepID=A0A086CHT3_9CHRO|nr:MAG: hydrogenobyrinic acid a,c-diamide synthase (glutamine-hydrolysing) [Candidatus Atelocyanobacterium thalassa isolate SIO64986]
MALIIAGDRSGTGKTTITLALLSFLRQKKAKVQSFKVGPDYIDPMFHTYITGRYCRNLDPLITSEDYVKYCFDKNCQEADYGLVEGVMGLFDGIPLNQVNYSNIKLENKSTLHYSSTAHIALLLDIPIVLVIDCRHLSASIAAIVYGYRFLNSNINILGVILNRVKSERHLALLKASLESIDVLILGSIYYQDDLAIPDRHLGLIPVNELTNLEIIFDKLAYLAQNCLNWDFLVKKSKITTSRFKVNMLCRELPITSPSHLKIAVANDKAFNFYYADNLDLLKSLGAELVYWSPVKDEILPKDVAGIYIGGGFPEMFAQLLSNNRKSIKSLRLAASNGMPIYAECGGLMYLCENIITLEGDSWPMARILPTVATMGHGLALGYRQAVASRSGFILKYGETFWGHEFHRSRLTIRSSYPALKLSNWYGEAQNYDEGWCNYNIYASYLHLHFGNYIKIPKRFLLHCTNFSKFSAIQY